MSKLNSLGAYNIFDLRDIAQKRLPKFLFDFVDRGAEDEIAVRNNRAALDCIKLNPRMLVDVSVRSQEITLFGNKQNMPIVIAPTGAAGLLWHEGEIALARAAKAAGIPFTLATNSITPMEKVAEQAGGRLWFQLYMWADRSMSHQLIQRARSNGYEGLVVTVDSVIHPNREYNQHNGYTRPFTLNRKNVTDVLTHPRWLFRVFARYMMTTGMPRRENYPDALRKEIYKDISLIKNESLNWADLKALALGAKAVLIGRSTLYGIAVAGEFGATHAIDIFRDEIDRILVQIGCRNVSELTPEYVSLPQIPAAA